MIKKRSRRKVLKSVKILQDLNYEKHDKLAKIAKTRRRLKGLGISKESIDAFEKLIVPKKYLYVVLQTKKNKNLYTLLNT